MRRKLLRRKIAVPPIWQGNTSRVRLLKRLEEAADEGRNVAIVASAGYGKTSLLADWSRNRRTAWLTLDAEDSELGNFLAYVAFTLESTLEGFKTEAWDLIDHAHERGNALAVMGTLLADLDEQVECSTGEQTTWLVLDDYHLAQSESLDKLLIRMLKYLPRAVRLAVASREPPGIEVTSGHARHELVLLTEIDLAFQLEELVVLRPNTPASDIVALHTSTGGWPAAVDLSSSERVSYIEEQILKELSPQDRAFLNKAAIVDVFDASICEEAFGEEFSADRRERLLRQRVVVRVDEGSYQVPQLLRHLLRSRLAEELPRAERRLVLCQAASALWGRGQELTAVRLYVEAGAPDEAADHLAQSWEAWLKKGRLETLANALAALKSENPILLLADGEVARQSGHFVKAHDRYEAAYTAFQCASDRLGAARARLGQAQALASRGQSDLARGLLAECSGPLASDPQARADICNLEGGLQLLEGRAREARPWFMESRTLGRQLADRFVEKRAAHNLGVCHTKLGDFELALQCYDSALRHVEADGIPRVWMTPINRALVLTYLGRADEGALAAEAALEIVRRLSLAREEAYALRSLGFAKARLTDLEGAVICYEAAELLARNTGDHLSLAYSLSFLADLACEQGAFEEAVRLTAEALDLVGSQTAQDRVPELVYGRAKALMAAGRQAEALPLARAIRDRAQIGGYRYLETRAESLLRSATAPTGGNPEHRNDADVSPDPHVEPKKAPRASDCPHLGREPELQIQCLGSFKVSRAGEEIEERDWQSFRARVLLAFLLHHPEGAAKSTLFEALYGQEATSEASLHMNLMRLRKALEPALERGQPSRFILRHNGRYQFNRQARVEVDTWRFDALTRRRPWELANTPANLWQALDLYRGIFLVGFEAQWIQVQRQDYRNAALGVCRKLLDSLEEGDSESAIRLSYRALEIDNLAEEFHRELMLRFIERKEPHRAVAHYAQCERIYAQEIGIRPPQDLLELVAPKGTA